ncbi:reverse transcriptase zinc-binding domain-containing protein [Tanacetum coccineum]
MRNFLWCHGNLGKGKSKVAWEVVCLPKDEGGLGIRRIECFNSALMTTHIWKLLTLKESLWVKWIHEYKLNGRNFWDIPLRGNMSWGWRKILKMRPIIREFIWCKIGDGSITSIWFDRWCDMGPLATHISPRDIFRAGLNLKSKVKDVIHNGTWIWPHELLVKYPFLSECHVPIIEDNSDCLEWRNSQGITKTFSVTQAWSDLRTRDVKVDWYSMVWFSSCIPRHAFNLWLIVRRKLKTQDLVRIWEISDSLGAKCLLCDGPPDSHDHLFFECSFAHAIWDRMKVLAGIASSPPNVYDIIHDLLPITRRRTMKSVIAKLVIAASTYFIWQERNWRLFNKGKRTHDQICDCIISSVRLKLLSCKLKKSKIGVSMARLWDLPEAIFL